MVGLEDTGGEDTVPVLKEGSGGRGQKAWDGKFYTRGVNRIPMLPLQGQGCHSCLLLGPSNLQLKI